VWGASKGPLYPLITPGSVERMRFSSRLWAAILDFLINSLMMDLGDFHRIIMHHRRRRCGIRHHKFHLFPNHCSLITYFSLRRRSFLMAWHTLAPAFDG
jgi:ribosomal protein L37E